MLDRALLDCFWAKFRFVLAPDNAVPASSKMPLIVSAGGMPAISAAGAAALSARHTRDATSLDTAFQHLTAARLASLEAELAVPASEAAPLLATAVLRRITHRVLDKRASFGDVGAALAQHGWSGAIQAMRVSAAGSHEALWQQVMEHEMTAYVPVQCQACGQRVPDETTPGSTDAEVGLSEAIPTAVEEPLVRAGWYRPPRRAPARPPCRAPARLSAVYCPPRVYDKAPWRARLPGAHAVRASVCPALRMPCARQVPRAARPCCIRAALRCLRPSLALVPLDPRPV